LTWVALNEATCVVVKPDRSAVSMADTWLPVIPVILSAIAPNWAATKPTIWSVVREDTCVEVRLATLAVAKSWTC